MGTINKDIPRFDVTAVYTHPEAHVDIILLHGLNGNPQKTWTAKKTGVYWPTDLLPKTLEDEGVRANILVYGYNADVAGNKDRNPSTNFIHEHAQTLVNYLTTFRKTKKTLRNPIIWVAHSLGGILLKKALEYSDSVRVAVHEDYRSVYVSTYAIVFLGTPHEGSDLARWGEMLQGMVGHVPRKLFDSEPILIKTLRKDSETLDTINEGFLHIQQRFKIHLVHENQKSDLKGTRSLIVESRSAAPRWYGVSSYGIEADHSGMCKFEGFNAPGYRQITSVITEWVRESPDLIRVRWNVEDQDRRNRAQLENMERVRPFLIGVPVGTNQIISGTSLQSPGQSSISGSVGGTGVGGSSIGDATISFDFGQWSPPQQQSEVERNETASTLELPLPPLPLPDAPPSPLPMLPASQPRQTLPPAPLPPILLSSSSSQLQQPPSNEDESQASLIPLPVSHTTPSPTTAGAPAKEPLFIHPEAFRPNSYFVGREDELKELHRVLQDPKRRSQGTSAALLRCQTGGGKTHMARQYVFEHRGHYPGGIFWLRASTVQELEDEFWRIARTVALRDLKRKQQLRQVRQQRRQDQAIEETEGEEEEEAFEDLLDHTKVVDHVRRWFNSFEGWLLVLDGIMFDPPGIARFVPDAPRTSMILTSTSPTGAGDHHFNNPKLLELPLLSTREAQELLLLEMERKKPWSRDDLRQAADLAQLLERLPLMIHVTAQHLKTTYEPLGTFLKRYRAKPQVGKIPAYEFVLEQLTARGAVAALNVLSVLAFFEQHTPVEMMVLGLRALDKSTPYKTRDAATHQKPSLNNTLKVLIAFALVERTDSYDLSPTSSRTSKRSLDLPSGETMDTLRMHSVIQRYIIEHLASSSSSSYNGSSGKKQHIFWLERSVEVFCRAFGEADARIRENPRLGMPDDYKRFLLHGKRLLAHLKHYARRSPEELQPLRERMEAKLPFIEAEADRLHKEIQAKIVGQSSSGGGSSGDLYQQTSIFDRANSLSESDSGTTSSRSHSQQDWTPLDEDFSGYFLSPVATGADQVYNAYGVPVLPYPVDDDDDVIGDDENEATPTLQDTLKAGLPPGSLFGEGGWQTIVVDSQAGKQKKSSTLLSHGKDDHKSPAGVGISRHTAEAPRRGSHVSSRDSLAEIRKHSPTPPRGGGVIKGGRSLSTGTAARPTGLLNTGANHHGMVASGLTPTDELSHAEISMAFGGVPAPGSSTAAVTQRFRDSIGSSSVGRKLSNDSSSGGGGGRSVLLVPTSARTSPGMEQQIVATMPPFPTLATRSARSSPGQGVSPFYPPGLPVERHSNSSLRRVEHPPPSFHQWNTTSYHPGIGLPRVESSSLGEDGAMTMSFPPVRTTTDRALRRQPGGVFSSPTMLWAEEEGPVISSAPMSRNPSSNSPSRYGSRHRSPDSIRGGGGGVPAVSSIAIPDRGRRHSSPLSSPMSSSIMMPSMSTQFPVVPGRPSSHSRPASVVTEPSPRIVPGYDVLEMPYQVPLSVAAIAAGPPNQPTTRLPPRSVVSNNNGGGGVSSQLPPRPPLAVTPIRRQSRYKRAWGKFRSGRGGGAGASAGDGGGSGSGSGSRGRSSRSSTSTSPRVGSVQSSPDPTLPSPLASSGVVGGEPMGRSGSGGIVVGGGGGVGGGRRQIIAFGDAPVDMDVASLRLRQRRENRARRNNNTQVGSDATTTTTTTAPPMSRSSSGGIGLGIMPEGEMR